LSKDEQEIPQIREVFELLVKQHPHYGNLLKLDGGDWVLAQKTMNNNKTYNISYRDTTNDIIVKVLHKVYRKLINLCKAK